jgi:hypothetical protein
MPDHDTKDAPTPAEGAGTGPHLTHDGAGQTPTAYDAHHVTAAGTPSEDAGEQVRAAAAEHGEAAEGSDGSGSSRHRTAKEIMNDPEDPRSPL